MTTPDDVQLPPLEAGCRLTVCIPARNEAMVIGRALDALDNQRDTEGRRLPRGSFDIIVLANNCSDATAQVVRDHGIRRTVAVSVVQTTFAGSHAHIGTARRFVMDRAAARLISAGRPLGVVASIDADTIAGEGWIAAIEREIAGRDAVAGYVTLARADHERLLAPLRLLYDRELAYRRILAEVEADIDPVPEDPAPRHGSFVGASFAVRAGCYRVAGGIPPLPRLEDLAFSHSLRRIDARVRHSLAVRATTSARRTPRVAGGFGSFIADLHERAQRGDSFAVEHPLRSLEDLAIRAALRRISRGADHPSDVARTAAILNLAPERWLPELERNASLGERCEHITQLAEPHRRRFADVPVETAIAMLRQHTNVVRFTPARESLHAG